MNITIDNYEAYLLDYMDGQLNPEKTLQLKQFVAAQGLDWAAAPSGSARNRIRRERKP